MSERSDKGGTSIPGDFDDVCRRARGAIDAAVAEADAKGRSVWEHEGCTDCPFEHQGRCIHAEFPDGADSRVGGLEVAPPHCPQRCAPTLVVLTQRATGTGDGDG